MKGVIFTLGIIVGLEQALVMLGLDGELLDIEIEAWWDAEQQAGNGAGE